MNAKTPDLSQPETIAAPAPEWFADLPWLQKMWGRVRLGHEGIMLDRINRNQQCVEVLARNAMTGDMQDTEGWPTEAEGEKVGVDIGDHDHVHHHYPVEQTESKPSQKSSLLPTLLLTGAALGIGGVPLAGKTLLQHVIGALIPTPTATNFEDTDTDTTIGLGSIGDLKE